MPIDPTVELVAWSGTASQLAMLLNRHVSPSQLRVISRMGGRSGDRIKIDLTLANTSGLLSSLRRRLDEPSSP